MWAKAEATVLGNFKHAESISNRRWIPKIVGTPLKATNNYSTVAIQLTRLKSMI